MLTPRGKIKVFISSICGVEKYDKLRTVLKQQIEETNLADVYLFEATGASTLTAQQHYVWELEDSDVCIFIIDNLDGVPAGVQKEIDAAKKHNKKSFFYFCDEQSKTPTAIQKGLTGPNTPKYKVVHSFNDLLEGAQSLIDDITEIYKYYCNGRFEPVEEATVQVSLTEELCDVTLIIDKTIIENTDCCKMYFHKMFSKFEKEKKGTSDFDDWCARFLPILFENASVKTFNTSMFLEELKKHQSTEHFAAVEKRWEAIQYYFNSDLQGCVEALEKALQIAKENNLSEWFIKDILIDLRNKRYELLETENKVCVEDPAQQELMNSQHALYYPLIDRMQSELYEKFADDTFKTKIQSPHTVSLLYYLENDEKTVSEPQLEAILLHTTLSWIDAESVDIRWYCVRILFLLGRNKTLHDIIGYQIINLIDNDNAFIKNLIQRKIKEHGIDNETQKYVATKCSIDNNYVVRKVHNELNT